MRASFLFKLQTALQKQSCLGEEEKKEKRRKYFYLGQFLKIITRKVNEFLELACGCLCIVFRKQPYVELGGLFALLLFHRAE